jgi:hypothetical protein
MPTYAYATWPDSSSCSSERSAVLIGTLGETRIRADLRVDPDHATACVEERPARVPPVDGCVDLNGVRELVDRRQGRERAPDRRDDADRERALVPERASDGRDGIADRDRRRVPERDRLDRGRQLVRPQDARVRE